MFPRYRNGNSGKPPGNIMAFHARCKRLVQPRATANNEAKRARKRESYHPRRRQTKESKPRTCIEAGANVGEE